jgi:hypothetical protein
MATPSKGILKPVMQSEIVRFKELAHAGHSLREICKLTGRSKWTVQKHVLRGHLVRSPPGTRMLAVLEIAERSNRSLGVLACDLGYASAESLAVTLTRAKNLRAFKNGGRSSWR